METKLSGVHTLLLILFSFSFGAWQKWGHFLPLHQKAFLIFWVPGRGGWELRWGWKETFTLWQNFQNHATCLLWTSHAAIAISYLSTSTVLSITYIRYPPILYVCPISLLFRKEKEGGKKKWRGNNKQLS